MKAVKSLMAVALVLGFLAFLGYRSADSADTSRTDKPIQAGKLWRCPFSGSTTRPAASDCQGHPGEQASAEPVGCPHAQKPACCPEGTQVEVDCPKEPACGKHKGKKPPASCPHDKDKDKESA